jgi:serine protease Do
VKGKKMNCHHSFKKCPMLIALLGTIFLGACSAQAQEVKPTASAPVQSQDPFAVSVTLDQAAASNQPAWNWTIARLWDSADDLLGANLQPVGDTLRAQLNIPAGEGLVVEGLRAEGACAQAGLQQNDVLLLLADKPLGSVGDLMKQLKAAGDSPVPLKILRGGKPATIRVRPIYRVTLGPVGEQRTEYYIGVSVVTPNDATRAQLGLPEGHGVVVSELVNGSPAEKAGIKKYDIILEVGDKGLTSPEMLTGFVQDAKGAPVQLKVLRTGKTLSFSVPAAERKVEASASPDAAYRLLFLSRAEGDLARYADVARLGLVNTNQSVPVALDYLQQIQNGQPTDANSLRQRLDHLEKELTAVRAALDKINETLKSKNSTKRD